MAVMGTFVSPWGTVIEWDENGVHHETGLSPDQYQPQAAHTSIFTSKPSSGGLLNTGLDIAYSQPQQPATEPTQSTAVLGDGLLDSISNPIQRQIGQQLPAFTATQSEIESLLRNAASGVPSDLLQQGVWTKDALSPYLANSSWSGMVGGEEDGRAMSVPIDVGNGQFSIAQIYKNTDGTYYVKPQMLESGSTVGNLQDVVSTATPDGGFMTGLSDALGLGIQLSPALLMGAGQMGWLDPYSAGATAAGGASGGGGLFGAGAGSSAGLPVFDAGMGAFINPATGGAMLEADALAALTAAGATPATNAGLATFINTMSGGAAAPVAGATSGLLGGAAQAAGGTVGAGAGSAVGSAAGSTLGSTLGKIGGALTGGGALTSGLIGAGANLLGGALQNKTNQDIAKQNADLIRQANEDKRFRPVGVTTRFGQSQFGYDADGRLISAGYNLSPELRAMQDRQMGMLPGLQSDYERAVQLGRGAMKTPQEFIAEQQGLLQPERERALAEIRNRAQQTGRGGLATMGTSTTMATNPELAAYYNAIQQENARLAANAPQQSLALASQGLGLMSEGYRPYQTAFGAAKEAETAGQGAMDIGTQLGAQASTAGARLQTPQMPNQVNPWTAGLMGGVNAYQQYQARQPVTTQNPYVPLTSGQMMDQNLPQMGYTDPSSIFSPGFDYSW